MIDGFFLNPFLGYLFLLASGIRAAGKRSICDGIRKLEGPLEHFSFIKTATGLSSNWLLEICWELGEIAGLGLH